MPNMKESLDLAETPFDILIDFVNFWARFTGLESMKINKVSTQSTKELCTHICFVYSRALES